MPPKARVNQRVFRSICWTLNREEPPVISTELTIRGTLQPTVDYYVYQKELAPTTFHVHWQGYLELNRQLTMTTIKQEVFHDDTVHIEKRRGTQKQAVDYCKDPRKRAPDADGFVEWGRPKLQGTQVGFQGVMDALKAGTTLHEINTQFPHIVASCQAWLLRTVAGFQEDEARKFRLSLRTYVFWGPTGTGKSRRVYHMHNANDIYVVTEPRPGAQMWFDGYIGQPVILLDDFYGSGISLEMMLRLLDIYPLQLQVKGGSTWALWTTVYITSNLEPKWWWVGQNHAESKWEALFRRLHYVVNIPTFEPELFT